MSGVVPESLLGVCAVVPWPLLGLSGVPGSLGGVEPSSGVLGQERPPSADAAPATLTLTHSLLCLVTHSLLCLVLFISFVHG